MQREALIENHWKQSISQREDLAAERIDCTEIMYSTVQKDWEEGRYSGPLYTDNNGVQRRLTNRTSERIIALFLAKPHLNWIEIPFNGTMSKR